MRILITGATGQLGRALTGELGGLGPLLTSDRSTLDLQKTASIAPKLDEIAPDIIINAAAYTAVDEAEQNRKAALLINSVAPSAIARWAAGNGVPLIHFSTDYVFSGSGHRAWSETQRPAPLSVYGTTKLAGEIAIRAVGGSYLLVRTAWVYAATGRNFLTAIIKQAQQRGELRVVADQTGSPTPSCMIASAVYLMLAGGIDRFRELASNADGLVHLTASGETTWHHFAEEIVSGLAARNIRLPVSKVIPISSGEYNSLAPRPKNSRLCLDRLNQVFGVSPPDWKTALSAVLDDFVALLGDSECRPN